MNKVESAHVEKSLAVQAERLIRHLERRDREKSETDLADCVREMLRHEDTVESNRMLWLAAFNGLLFTALGFTWDKPDARLIIGAFCILGIAVSSVVAHSLWAAAQARARLVKWWDEVSAKQCQGPDVIGWANRNHNYIWVKFPPWAIVAVSFSIAWAFVLQQDLTR